MRATIAAVKLTLILCIVLAACSKDGQEAPGAEPGPTATTTPTETPAATPTPAPTPAPAPTGKPDDDQSLATATVWLEALGRGDAAALTAASAAPFELEPGSYDDDATCEGGRDAAGLAAMAECLTAQKGLKTALSRSTVDPNVATPPPDALRTPSFVKGWQADHTFVFFQLAPRDDAPPEDDVRHALDGLLAIRLQDGQPVVDGAALRYAAIRED